MTSSPFILQAPYVCAFAVDTANQRLGFCTTTLGVETYYSTDFDEVRQFTSLEEALTSARSVDPTCEKNYIYGPLPVDTVSNPAEVFIDAEVGIPFVGEFFVTSPADPSCNVVYQWFVKGTEQTDALTNTFTYTPISDDLMYNVSINCKATVTGADNWKNTVSHTFMLQVWS